MNFYKVLKKTVLKKQLFFLFFLWAFVQGYLIWKNGIVTNMEASKYIDEANYFLKSGNFNTNNYYLYSTQIFLIAGIIKLHLSFTVIVFIQLLLNLLATIMFYKLASSFLCRPLTASLATFFFIINIPYQVYTSFLFTESIFYSLTVIYSSYVLRLKRITIEKLIFILLFTVLLCITRPTGILFFIATALYIFFRFFYKMNAIYKTLIVAAFIGICVIIINTMLQTGGSLDFMLPFKKENIICGVNTINTVDIKTFEKGNSLQGIIYYIFNNEHQFLKLAKLKTLAFFGMLRTYYSLTHNILLVLFFYPFYILSFMGVWKTTIKKDKRIIYIIIIIMLYWITTLLTCDDWHNRFILTVSPFFFLLGFAAFENRKSRSNAE